MKTKTTILAVIFITLLATSILAFPVRASPTKGPRIDEVLIKIYDSDTAEFIAFEACDIDMVDWPLGASEVDKWTGPGYEHIELDFFKEMGMYEVDVNNNLTMPSYPDWRSPTSYKEFRQAIACMIDKPYIVNTIVGGYGAGLEAPIMPWLRWYDPTMPTYSYDPAAACQYLYDGGWRDNADPYSGAKVHFPPGHTHAGDNLDVWLTNGPHGATEPGIIFYRRSDSSSRNLAGNLIIHGDGTHLGLEAIGIPVDDNSVPTGTSGPKVMYIGDYHCYTGGWSLGRDPDHLFDLYHSSMINFDPNAFSWNYGHINDPTWDGYVEKVKYATTLEMAETNAHLACQRFGDQAFFMPLWTTCGYMAHKKPWHVLNVDSYSVRDSWNLYCINNPTIGATGGQLKWGFKDDAQKLNPIYSQWVWDWQIMGELFDSLISMNPLNIAVDMPSMATAWTVGTWTNPDDGETCSKISFTLRDGMNWINPTNGAILGAVTPADVVFSFQYVYDNLGWNYPAVADIYENPDGSLKIEVSGNTITFYETVKSVWALHWAGGLPIIPKFIYENIPDPHGFYAGGLTAEETLIGTGSFYFVSYTAGVSCLLRANRNYFQDIVPNIDTDPINIKIDWGIFKSNPKSGDWVVNVLDLIIVANALGWTGPPGDVPADINKDGAVNVLDLIVVAINLGASW